MPSSGASLLLNAEGMPIALRRGFYIALALTGMGIITPRPQAHALRVKESR
jgi:hypothetical protein